MKGYKVKLKVSIFLQLKVPGKLFLGKGEEAVEAVSEVKHLGSYGL